MDQLSKDNNIANLCDSRRAHDILRNKIAVIRGGFSHDLALHAQHRQRYTLQRRLQRQLPEPPMALIFFERVGHQGRRPSPFSWRIRYALAHKAVDFEVRPARFADVEIIRALTGQHLTPVLSDGDHAVFS
jgi:hypothetical protein